MRRLLASLLMALIGSSPIPAAAFVSDADSKVPACCRRDGRHHCSLTSVRADAGSGLALRTGRCRLYPAAKAMPVHQIQGLTGIAPVTFAGFFSQPSTRIQAETRSRISYSQAGQKRGPPALRS